MLREQQPEPKTVTRRQKQPWVVEVQPQPRDRFAALVAQLLLNERL